MTSLDCRTTPNERGREVEARCDQADCQRRYTLIVPIEAATTKGPRAKPVAVLDYTDPKCRRSGCKGTVRATVTW